MKTDVALIESDSVVISMMRANSALAGAVSDLPRTPGVYVISLKDEILYVGESTNLRQRVAANPHNKFLKLPGSSLRFLECGNHKDVESYLIETLRPTLNWKSPNHAYWRYRSLLVGKSVSELVSDTLDPVSQGLIEIIASMKKTSRNGMNQLTKYDAARCALLVQHPFCNFPEQ